MEEDPNSGKIIGVDDESGTEDEPLDEFRPAKKQKVGHRTETESYAIDIMRCETTQNDLDRLREMYTVSSNIDL